MKALIFKIRFNSLYSIRVPFTWQSALTYPFLPPSGIIGLLANALQRYENKGHPKEYLIEIEKEIIWAGSRLISPCIIKSYTTSAITKWDVKLGEKSTNALGRELGYTKSMEIMAIFKTEKYIQKIQSAISTTPLTCGDSESPVTVIEKCDTPLEVKEFTQPKDSEIEIMFPLPFLPDKFEIKKGTGRVYLVHEKCLKEDKNFPLIMYILPLKEQNGIVFPEKLILRLNEETKLYYIPRKQIIVFPHMHRGIK